jgi:hypothetical protein
MVHDHIGQFKRRNQLGPGSVRILTSLPTIKTLSFRACEESPFLFSPWNPRTLYEPIVDCQDVTPTAFSAEVVAPIQE